MSAATQIPENVMKLASELTVAQASLRAMAPVEVGDYFRATVEELLKENAGDQEPRVEREVQLQPAVPVEESVTPDYLVCLEDGKRFKMLKRHLRTAYGLSPEEYRRRWGLPADYPMVAPNYSALKSNEAKQTGLGTYDRTLSWAPRARLVAV